MLVHSHVDKQNILAASYCYMHSLPLVSCFRSGNHLRHLDTNVNQTSDTHVDPSGKSPILSPVSSRAVGPMVLSPHRGISLETQKHIQGELHSSRW